MLIFWKKMLQYIAIAAVTLITVACQQTPCGVPNVKPTMNRIVGGQQAVRGSWPWTVMLLDDFGFVAGSGVLLDNHVILTSAQHFETKELSLYEMRLGKWQVLAGRNNISGTDRHEKYSTIRRLLLHPGYNTTTLENDIAIIITDDPIAWNDHTMPVCLPNPGTLYEVGQQCYLTGWGSTSSTGNEETLNQLLYPILDDSICANVWSDYLPNSEICAGYTDQQKYLDCYGDIGSPLLCQEESGVWIVQGLASSGGNCQDDSMPGIFEDVSMYYNWIMQNMESSGYPYQY